MNKEYYSKKKCKACEGGVTPKTESEAREILKSFDGWSLEGAKSIIKKYKFKNFIEAMKFVNKVADIANQKDHHPDIFISYGKVTIILSTHAIGGLSDNDFIVAAKVDAV